VTTLTYSESTSLIAVLCDYRRCRSGVYVTCCRRICAFGWSRTDWPSFGRSAGWV